MNKLFRALIAGYGAKKLGGGCFGTILVFIIIYYALGTCNSHPSQTVPANHSSIIKNVKPSTVTSQNFNRKSTFRLQHL